MTMQRSQPMPMRRILNRMRRWAASSAALGIAIVALLCVADPAAAQRQVPQSRTQTQLSFAPVVRQATPAVVNVYVSSRVRGYRSPFQDDPFFRRFFGEQFGMPRERVQNSLGSGVIVSPNGLIVTNTHVIKSRGTADISVVLSDKRAFKARVILQDEKTDIAILRMEGFRGRLPYLQFADSDTVEVGDLVLAIGNPFGVGQTVTSGIISALSRTQVGRSENQVFLQTDAAINPGNSGGALVDMRGRLVGINTAIFSRSGGSNGIGFAIPANLVRLYVDSAVQGRQSVAQVWLGAQIADVTGDVAGSLGLDRVAGAIVESVSRRGPAQQAGLQVGDIIAAVDGRKVADARAARYRITTKGIGNTAKLDVIRRGRRLSLDMPIREAPKPTASDVRDLRGEHPLDGVRVANLVPAIALQLDMKEQDAVAVVGVYRNGYGASLGFRRGDIIQEINGRAVSSIDDLTGALRRRPRAWSMSVLRGNRVLRLQVPG
jgi:Do/DeqQ family serine protease